MNGSYPHQTCFFLCHLFCYLLRLPSLFSALWFPFVVVLSFLLAELCLPLPCDLLMLVFVFSHLCLQKSPVKKGF